MNTVETFKTYIASITNQEGYQKPLAFGLGIRRTRGDKTLDVHFPKINWDTNFGAAALLQDVTGHKDTTNGFTVVSKTQLQQAFDSFAAFHHEIEKHPNIALVQQLLENYNQPNTYQEIDVIAYFLFEKDNPVENAEEAYFKLQCLSQLHVKPHGVSLEGAFGKLSNIAWTNQGPILPEDLSVERIKATFSGNNLAVTHIDKFPYMVNYHIPNGVRIASGSQVRLGAHLAPGTTVMPAGFVNFNAGTLGNAMIEGRVSAGVVVGNDSDVGGGGSIMGTLSGGNKTVVAIGDNCLIGANAGTSISLGYGCTIAAGVYVTGASKVYLYGEQLQPTNLEGASVAEGENVVKAARLSGKDNMLFIQDTTNGHLTCRPNIKVAALNASLHTKD